jgi:small subunit ribosomal protein S1
MFEASIKTKRFEKGQTIEGSIVAIGPEVAFVNVGGKGEATIALDELKDDEGRVEVAVGERIQATIVSTAGGITLSRKLIRGAVTLRQLEDAFQAGLPVEGRVEREVKGGYEVRIARQRGFCPISQIDIHRTTDAAVHVGRSYTFRIVEFKEGGRNLVVSRRAVLEEEQKAQAAEVRKAIVPGAVVTGRVVSVREFGAFVDLGGGVQGLLHVSEMGWSRVSAASVVAVGDDITVKVLRVEDDGQKIALGLKQLQDDPWSKVEAAYAVGEIREGRVTRVADFGAFVELEPGIEGLAHASTFPPTGRPGGWAKSVSVGMTGPFEIMTIDLEKKRIGVAPFDSLRSLRAGPFDSLRSLTAGPAPAKAELVTGTRVTGKVDRHEHYGVFVFLGPGKTGLIPMSETGVGNDADVKKAFPVGSEVEVVITEIDPAGRRIRLSKKAVQAAQEAAEVREYTERTDAKVSESFGSSLAEKLRGALKPRDK